GSGAPPLGAPSSPLQPPGPGSRAAGGFGISGEAGVAMSLGTVFPRGHAVVGLAVDEGIPIATPNLLADPRFTFTPGTRAMIERAGHRSVLGVPLRIGDRVIGALGVGARVGRQFDDDEIRLTQAFADQAALALRSEERRVG